MVFFQKHKKKIRKGEMENEPIFRIMKNW